MIAPLVLENEWLRVAIDPLVGGAITSIRHKPLGASVLGTVPWEPLRSPEPALAAASEPVWLTRYTGGWPLMFPNAGDACEVHGMFHGFHGEASVAPWRSEAIAGGIRLSRAFFTVPVRMTRDVTLDADTLTVSETVVSNGPEPVDVIWGQHVTFGSDLLDGEAIVDAGARTVLVDAAYDPPANPWRPGSTGVWPHVAGKSGTADLSRPSRPLAALAYLTDFERPFVSLRRKDGHVAAELSWDEGVYHCVWYWCELGGTTTGPWCGRGRLIGLEPCSTYPGAGLKHAQEVNARLVRIEPGTTIGAKIVLRIFQPGPPTSD